MLLPRHTWQFEFVNTNECHLSITIKSSFARDSTSQYCCPCKHHHHQSEHRRALRAGRWAGCTLTCPNSHWQDLECSFTFFLNKTKMLPTYYKSLNNNFEIVYELINSTCIKLNGSEAWYKAISKTTLLLTGSTSPSRIILLKHVPF